jgi:hypothetical protein
VFFEVIDYMPTMYKVRCCVSKYIDLTLGKVYYAEDAGTYAYRIVDDSGDSYLYSKSLFATVEN